ncbi:ABC transporter [Vairimorpha necatrix]|uniref:ABC transporter n=1 Tax=Vairimorpha necatrix TaxID=6039 RepID=A0AAX4JB27_9MICR
MNPKVNLSWRNLKVSTNQGIVLDTCNGKINHSQISILLGGTGAGKSLLFNILAGRQNNTLQITGEILINFNNINNSYLKIGSVISLVDETFYFFQKQTIWETFYFSVKSYHLDKNTTFLLNKTQEIINILDLENIKNNMLFNLSQGEKKLVSIGAILAEDPDIILLDEPFVMIDKWHTKRIMKILKKLTDHHKTVLVSINSPDIEILKKCDKIFVLANSSFIFDGRYEEFEKFFQKKNEKIEDFLSDLLTVDYTSEIIEINKRQKIRELKERWYRNHSQDIDTTMYQSIKYSDRKNNLKKISLILKRHLKIFKRSKETYRMVIIQKATFLIITCIVYPFIGYYQKDIQTRVGLCGFFVLNSIDRSMSIALSSFSQSKLIAKREIVAGMYTSTEMYISEYIFDFVLLYLSTVLYVVPVYWIAQVNDNLYRFVLFLINHFCLVHFTVAYSLLIGIVTHSHKEAHMYGSVGLLIFSAFSGIFVNVSTIPSFSRWITWFSPLYYALEFSLQVSLTLSIFIIYILLIIFLGLIFSSLKFKPRMVNEKVDVWKDFIYE